VRLPFIYTQIHIIATPILECTRFTTDRLKERAIGTLHIFVSATNDPFTSSDILSNYTRHNHHERVRMEPVTDHTPCSCSTDGSNRLPILALRGLHFLLGSILSIHVDGTHSTQQIHDLSQHHRGCAHLERHADGATPRPVQRTDRERGELGI